MGQAQLSTPGRPLTLSDKNNKQNIFVIIFVDSESKNGFL